MATLIGYLALGKRLGTAFRSSFAYFLFLEDQRQSPD